MKVAIIGTGNIGTDLLIKLLRIDCAKVVAFVGRRPATKQIPDGVPYYSNGIQFFVENPTVCDIVFDCTDAFTATENARIFLQNGITVIDLTPSKIGQMCVPNVNCDCLKYVTNVNMVTCGGQVAIPLLKYLSTKCMITYAEVITQIASHSAGMATRINIDKYIETTEKAIKSLTPVPSCKVILNVNPCEETVMQTTILLHARHTEFDDFDAFIDGMRTYVPYYTVVSRPAYTNCVLMVSVKVLGSGDYLSKYSGNLDVINCAAIEIMKKIIHNGRRVTEYKSSTYDRVLDI